MNNDNFKIPIKYVDNIPISDSLMNDLELLDTVNNDQQPIYHNIFNPTNNLAKTSLKQWDSYTTNTDFLNDSQNLYTKINDLKVILHYYTTKKFKI